MKISFCGATRSVSGSLHVLESQRRHWLLDCGLFQGWRRDMYDRNAALPLEAHAVSGVLLSHAHVDHSGRLPRLVKLGFRGPIYATPATIDLCALLLDDSAYVLHAQTAILNQRRAAGGKPPLPDLYTAADVAQTLRQMVPVEWDKAVNLGTGLEACFHPAGHILGASSIVVRERTAGAWCNLAFSGDIGQPDDWVLPDPVVPADTHHVIVESTYGDRTHRPYLFARGEMARNISATLAEGGIVVIPAFSVGRTQRLIYELRGLIAEGLLPPTPIYVDSPLSVEACRRFSNHPAALRGIPADARISVVNEAHTIVTPEASRALSETAGPFIVITAAGMCEAGRVLHHLKRCLPDARSRVVFVGFCAEHTLGRWLMDGHDAVRINGATLPVRARIDKYDTFSSHADQPGLVAWVRAQPDVRSVFLVHGEEPQAFALAEQLESNMQAEIVVPFAGETFALAPDGVHSVY